MKAVQDIQLGPEFGSDPIQLHYSFDYISDRQDLIDYMKARELGLHPYMYDRTDMYWFVGALKGPSLSADVTYAINAKRDPRSNLGYGLSLQGSLPLLDTPNMRELVVGLWNKSPQKAAADIWIMNLEKAGYFDHGVAYGPHTDSGICKHCQRQFKRGTTHPHTYLEDWNFKGEKKIIHHHGILNQKITALGLKTEERSILDPNQRSLEDLEVLTPYIIT